MPDVGREYRLLDVLNAVGEDCGKGTERIIVEVEVISGDSELI
jgi:hypothetical protein